MAPSSGTDITAQRKTLPRKNTTCALTQSVQATRRQKILLGQTPRSCSLTPTFGPPPIAQKKQRQPKPLGEQNLGYLESSRGGLSPRVYQAGGSRSGTTGSGTGISVLVVVCCCERKSGCPQARGGRGASESNRGRGCGRARRRLAQDLLARGWGRVGGCAFIICVDCANRLTNEKASVSVRLKRKCFQMQRSGTLYVRARQLGAVGG